MEPQRVPEQGHRPSCSGRPGQCDPVERVEVVYVGIDTHADTHHVAVIDGYGRALDDVRVEATASGYRKVLTFLAGWARVVVVGVECTGSYGAGGREETAAGGGKHLDQPPPRTPGAAMEAR